MGHTAFPCYLSEELARDCIKLFSSQFSQKKSKNKHAIALGKQNARASCPKASLFEILDLVRHLIKKYGALKNLLYKI